MPKPSRGGKRTGYINRPAALRNGGQQQSSAPVVTPTFVTPPTPQQVMRGNVVPGGGVPFDQFEKMSDDQKADVITKALGVSVPVFLDDSGLQRLAYFTGLNTKPQVVDDSALAQIPGQDLYRSVTSSARANYNRSTDISYSGKDIYNQIATGDYTMYSDSGGSVHGKGIYFDDSKGSYGSGSAYTIIHAKVAPGAKNISENRLDADWSAERRRGTKLAMAISNADYSSQKMIYAMAKGYDVVTASNGYRMFLNRRGLIVSKKTF